MKAIVRGIAVLAALAAGHSIAQPLSAESLLKRSAAVMGAGSLNSIRFAAAGSGGGVGQPYTAGKAWPKQNIRFTRHIDYQSASLQDEVVRSRAEPRGGTAVPLTGEQSLSEFVSGSDAWNVVAMNVQPGARYADERIAQIWLSPHGVIKSAMKNNASLQWRTRGGKSFGAVSFAEPGRFTATAYIGEDYLVHRVEARVPNPVLGDMPVAIEYSEYRDLKGTMFPGRIEESQGGFMTMNLVVTDVQPNAKVAIAVPEQVRSARETVRSEKVADGVWFLTGGSHNSLAVEMRDHVVAIDGPLGDLRAVPVIEEIKKLIPGKPIRYVVNSHVHFDHSGGLGAFAAEGAVIVTHASNRPYLERALAASRSISPDEYAKSKKKAAFRTVNDKLVLSDGSQAVELYHLRGNIHTDGMLIAYLPGAKLLVQADMPVAPLAPGATPPANGVNFAENVARHKLAPERIAGLHGGIVPASNLARAIGK